jgi:hypothetical protein
MNASQPCQSIADQVREIPLLDLLHRHGFQTRPEGISFRARNDRYNIVVTGNRWFDNKAGVGGVGVQLHTCLSTGSEFRISYAARGYRFIRQRCARSLRLFLAHAALR